MIALILLADNKPAGGIFNVNLGRAAGSKGA